MPAFPLDSSLSIYFCLQAGFIVKGICTELFFFCTSWKNRMSFLSVSLHPRVFLLLLWSVLGVFIVWVNISWPSPLIHRTTVSHCCSQTAWINERRQQERPAVWKHVFPQQVNPYRSVPRASASLVLGKSSDRRVVWWSQLPCSWNKWGGKGHDLLEILFRILHSNQRRFISKSPLRPESENLIPFMSEFILFI